MIRILNEPDDGYDYEFVVVKPTDNDNEYEWVGNYASCFMAESPYDIAQRIGGIVLHNVRIAGRERKTTK